MQSRQVGGTEQSNRSNSGKRRLSVPDPVQIVLEKRVEFLGGQLNAVPRDDRVEPPDAKLGEEREVIRAQQLLVNRRAELVLVVDDPEGAGAGGDSFSSRNSFTRWVSVRLPPLH